MMRAYLQVGGRDCLGSSLGTPLEGSCCPRLPQPRQKRWCAPGWPSAGVLPHLQQHNCDRLPHGQTLILWKLHVKTRRTCLCGLHERLNQNA